MIYRRILGDESNPWHWRMDCVFPGNSYEEIKIGNKANKLRPTGIICTACMAKEAAEVERRKLKVANKQELRRCTRS